MVESLIRLSILPLIDFFSKEVLQYFSRCHFASVAVVTISVK